MFLSAYVSVCPSVTKCRPTVGLSVGVDDVGVESYTVVFPGRDFLFTSSDNFAAGWRPNRRKS